MKSLVDLVRSIRGLFVNSPKRQQELDEAKKLFYSYDCNSFFMMKEGESKKYNRYRVGIIQENKWRDEFVAYWLEKIAKDGFSMQALWHIRNAGSNKCIPALIAMADKGDSYAKLWIADAILSLSDGIVLANEKGRQAAIALFKSILRGPVIISKQYRLEVDQFMMSSFDASTPEEYLVNYSKRKLTELKVKLSDL